MRVPEEAEVRRRLARTTSLVFVAFLVIGWVGMTSATAFFNSGVAVGVMGTLLLVACGSVLGALLFRASERELALIRTLSIFLGEAPVGVVFLDERGQVTYANRSIERLTGRSLKEVKGASAAVFVPPDDRPRLVREMEQRARGESGVYEMRLLRADGGVLQVWSWALPFFKGERYDGSLAAIIDLTELDEARAEAGRYRDLSGFALDAVTHDLSNRMQEVITRGDLAAALLPTGADRAAAALASLAAAADRAARLIKEVKQIAAAEREAWPKREVELAAFVNRALEIAGVSEPTRVEAHILPEAAAVRIVASDLAPLVVSKLIEEAAEGAPSKEPSEPLMLEARLEAASAPEVVLTIRGFAREVSEDNLRLMLAPLREQRGEATPWRSGGRLALAPAVAQAHGWGLRAVRGEKGKGVVFEVRIPAKAGGGGAPPL